jgi:hypothetical protein
MRLALARWIVALSLVAAAVVVTAPQLRADSCTFMIEIINGDITILEVCDYPFTNCDFCQYAMEVCQDECAGLFFSGEINQIGLAQCRSKCMRARSNCLRNCSV